MPAKTGIKESLPAPATAFRVAPRADTSLMLKFRSRMEQTLLGLHHAEIPGPTYSARKLRIYCESLVAGQRNKADCIVPGSWSVAPTHGDMPGDARVDFVYFPTYIAVATLSKVLLRFPGIAIQIDGFADALKSGLHFSTLRGMQGHGYDGIYELAEGMEYLWLGEVPLLLQQAPELGRDLLKLMTRIGRSAAKDLQLDRTVGSFDKDIGSVLTSIVASTELLQDPTLLAEIRRGRQEPARDLRRRLQW